MTVDPAHLHRSQSARVCLALLVPVMALLTLALSPAVPAAQERQRVRMTQPVATLTLLVIYIARGNQYFEGEGLAVDVISTGGGGPDVQALLAGNVDFTATATPLVINSYLQGKPLLGVVNILNRSNMDVVLRKDLADGRGIKPEMSIEAKIQALKGLTVGVTRMGALTQQVGFYFIKKAGLEPQKDIRIVGMGGDMAVLAGLENRKIDAFVMSPPLPEMAVAKGVGVWLIRTVEGEDPKLAEYLQNVIIFKPETTRERPELVRKVVRAAVRALRWINESPPEAIFKSIQPYFKGVDAEVMTAAIHHMKPSYRADGRITEAGVNAVQDVMAAAGILKRRVSWTEIATNDFLPR